jgi:hypothetical protein
MIRLNEAIKISLEIDPKDLGVQASTPAPQSVGESGNFGKYVDELASGSPLASVLRETAEGLHRSIEESLEDLALREDKREFNAGLSRANSNVLRSWRAFLRELKEFEGRFGRKR